MTDKGRATTAATQTAAPGHAAAPEPAELPVPPGRHAGADGARSEPRPAATPDARTDAGNAEAGGAAAAPMATAEPGFAAAPIAEAEPEQAAAPGPEAQAIVPAEPEPGPAATRPPLGPREQALRILGVALILLGALVLGFAVYLYGLSSVQEGRSQSVLYQRLQVELANQVAPLGSATPGAPAATPGAASIPLASPGVPVAVLRIPAIGIRDMVVVQGTSPEDLTLGPGHLSDTPLPGQAGVSEIFGRRETFGAPFARLDQLQLGDVIQVITGQGTSTYRVAAIGNSKYVINDPVPNRLVLLTASSPVIPAYYIEVDARLTSTAQNGPPVPQVISAPELPLSGDSGALGLVMGWALLLALVSAGGTIAAIRWSRWPAYLATAPVLLAVLWNLYQALAALLPNVY
jgi:sortase A